jgi:hypothetical integral membrane protein (TIGR02206 family)
VLTPDLGYGFPDLLFFTYFATHSGAVAAAFLLVFGARRTPRPGVVWRVYAATLAFALLAAAGTLLTGGNYMYLRRKPAHASLLDVMGPWPAYILVAAAFALLSFSDARGICPLHRAAFHCRGPSRITMARSLEVTSTQR